MYTKYPDDEIQVFLYVHKGQTHDVSWNMDTWGHKGHSQLEAREASVLIWRQWIVVTINFCLSVFLNECDHRPEPVSDASCRSMLERAESHLVARASKTNKTKAVPFLQWFGD